MLGRTGFAGGSVDELDPKVGDAVDRPEDGTPDVVAAEDVVKLESEENELDVWTGEEVDNDDAGGLEGAEVGGVDDGGGCEVGGAASEGVNWM